MQDVRPRMHPIVRFGVALAAFRMAGLVYRYLVQPDASLGVRAGMFVPAAIAHLSVIMAIAAGLLFCAAPPRLRRPAVIAAALITSVLMIAGQADFTVSSITGAPLTPTVFRTFRGLRVVASNEFLDPLRANWLAATIGTLGFTGVAAWMSGVAREPADSAAAAPSMPASATLAVVGLSAAIAATIVSSAPAPIEIAFGREYLGLDDTRLHEPEPAAIAGLRSLVGLPISARWISDKYPLVYAPVRRTSRADSPDVVVVMVESLRAEDLPFITGRAPSVTPRLDALAAGSVVFTSYVSNAFPSAPSVVAFHASAWPHRRKEIITDFAAMHFDSLPERLGSLGYDTLYVGADPHFDNQDRWLSRWYGGVRDLVAGGAAATDRAIVSQAIDDIRRHDRTSDKPLFAFVSTYSTHYPYRLPADAGPATEDDEGSGLAAHYRRVLRYTDAHIGTLLDALADRPRRDHTVTIVVGDHAFYTNLGKTSGLPENDNEWTAAMISGPESLVGPARRVTQPASHVDMLPTILALVGDDRPTAAVGSNLLGPARRAPAWAMAIRPGGLRFDRDGYSAFVDARLPDAEQIRPAFPAAARGEAPNLPTAAQLTAWVDDWSYLIEHDRVWNPALLGQARQNEYASRGLKARDASDRFERPLTR